MNNIAVCTHPDITAAVLIQFLYFSTRKGIDTGINRVEGFYFMSVVTVEPVERAKPQETGCILQHTTYCIVRQSVVRRNMIDGGLIFGFEH